ncbi:hypothetical protein G9A89_016732 [Geosiphon pyriformis]|nr:hypothetical protein G9A89_016732 [Geosiphon pyriformis]
MPSNATDPQPVYLWSAQQHFATSIQETTIVPKIKCIPQYQPISSGSQRHVSVTTVVNKGTSKQTKPQLPISNSKILTKLGTISKHLPANDAAANLPSTSLSDSSLLTTSTSNISTAATHNILATATSNLSTPINSDTAPKFNLKAHKTGDRQWLFTNQFPVFQLIIRINYLSLLITPENTTTNNLGSNQQQALTNNILPATVTNDKLLTAIFPFDLEETIKISLFSGAALEEKPITIVTGGFWSLLSSYAKINGHIIKLILDSRSAGSIITRQLMDQLADEVIKIPIGKIDNLLIEINGIIIPIKVLVMKATQYQALVGNDWLSKTNTILDWMTQELQLSQNTNVDHNELPLILAWDEDNHGKGKQKEEHTWETTIGAWIDDNQNELPPTLSWKEKGKGKKREDNLPEETESTKDITITATTTIHTTQMQRLWEETFFHGSLDHTRQKLLNTNPLLLQAFKWNNKPCLACGKQLLDKGIWNDIPGREGTCDTSCQYTILINNWVNRDEIWQMANTKVEGAMPSEILEIKNNSPEPVNIILVPNPDTFFDIKTNSKNFHEHYQNLALTREEQEEQLAQLNT